MQPEKLEDKRSLEKEFFLRGPKSLTIKELLQIPAEFRSFQHCKEILNHTKDNKFLSKYADTDQIFDIVRELRLKFHKAGDVIFRQGQIADAFYIILAGEVKVYLDQAGENKYFADMKEVATLKTGDSFGELALIYDTVRSASIVTSEKTELIVLNKENFRKHIRSVQTQHIAQLIDFFKNFSSFQTMSPDKIASLAGKAIVHRVQSKEIVVNQGEEVDHIYFIKSGRVKVIRKIDFRINPETGKIPLEESSDPTSDDYALGNVKKILVEIDELSNGDYFGDYAMFQEQKLEYSVVASIPCEFITITKKDTMELKMDVMYEFYKNSKPYPDDSELRRIYADMIKWHQWKKKTMDNIIIEKANSKLGFNHQMRKPFKKLHAIDQFSVPIENEKTLKIIDVKDPRTQQYISPQKYLRSVEIEDNKMYAIVTNPTKHLRRHAPKSTQNSMSVSNLKRSSLGQFQIPQTTTNAARDFSSIKFDFTKPKHKEHKKMQSMLASTSNKKDEKKPKKGQSLLDSLLMQSAQKSEENAPKDRFYYGLAGPGVMPVDPKIRHQKNVSFVSSKDLNRSKDMMDFDGAFANAGMKGKNQHLPTLQGKTKASNLILEKMK